MSQEYFQFEEDTPNQVNNLPSFLLFCFMLFFCDRHRIRLFEYIFFKHSTKPKNFFKPFNQLYHHYQSTFTFYSVFNILFFLIILYMTSNWMLICLDRQGEKNTKLNSPLGLCGGGGLNLSGVVGGSSIKSRTNDPSQYINFYIKKRTV